MTTARLICLVIVTLFSTVSLFSQTTMSVFRVEKKNPIAELVQMRDVFNPVCLSSNSGVSDSLVTTNVIGYYTGVTNSHSLGENRSGISRSDLSNAYEARRLNSPSSVLYSTRSHNSFDHRYQESDNILANTVYVLQSKPERAIVSILIKVRGRNVGIIGKVVEYHEN